MLGAVATVSQTSAAPAPSAAKARGVELLVADPELARDLSPQDAHAARRLAVPVAELPAGPWAPRLAADWGLNVSALLLLDGVLTREVLLHDRVTAQLLSPGDVLVPWGEPSALLPCRLRWTVNERARVAELDERFARAVGRWPSLAARVQDRLAAQGDRLAVHMAISQLGRVDLRVLALLWHLAERWGRVTPEGVVVPLRLTHAMVGRLVGAQRPTVTLAVGELQVQGALERRDDGTWLLHEASRDRLAPSDALAEPPAPSAAVVAAPAADVAPPDAPRGPGELLPG